MPQSPTDAYAFLSALRPYMEAFVERNPGRRLVLLRKALVPQAEICGPSRVFAGYAEISEKIDGFHKNWPDCHLVLAGGVIMFKNAGHFPKAIVGPDGQIRAAGAFGCGTRARRAIQRVLAFWGQHPQLPASWPEHLTVQFTARG